MQRVPETMATPPHTGTVVLRDESAPVGSVDVLDFQGAGVSVSVSGSYGTVTIPGAGGGDGGVEQIGVYGLDDGVPLGTGTDLEAGYGLDLTLSGTRLHLQAAPPVSGSVVLSDEGAVLGSVTHVDVRGARATATLSGSYGTIEISPDPQQTIGIMGWHDGVPVGTGSVLNAVGLALSQSGSVLLLSDEVVDGYTSEWYMRTGGGVEAIVSFPGAMTVQGAGVSQSLAFNMTNAYGDFMDGLFQGMLPYTLPDTGGDSLTNVGWLKLYDKNDPDVQWFYRLNGRPVRTVIGGEPTGSWTFVNVTRLVSKGEFSSGTLVAASFVPPTLAYQGLLGYEDGAIVGTGTRLDVGYGLDLSVSGQVYGGARFLLEVAPPVSGTVVIADEGTILGSVPIVNFRGAGVTASISGSYADVNVPGAASEAHDLLSTTHPDTLTGTVAQGDLVIGNGTPKWAKLPIGATGTLLGISAGLPAWVAQSYIDHGSIAGLADDDHPQYLLRQPTADVDINESGGDFDFRIESVANAKMFWIDAGNSFVAIGGAIGDTVGQIANFGPNSIIFFEDGTSRNFRVEGVGQANAFFVQGSDGAVGIRTNAPLKALDVRGTIAFYGAGTVPNYFAQGAGNNMQINSNVDDAGVVGDTSKAQWKLILGAALDQFSIRHSPAGATYTETTFLVLTGATGNVGIGASPHASAILDLVSTTKAFRPPVMTTGERDAIASPQNGMVIWNSSTGQLEDYNGGWAAV